MAPQTPVEYASELPAPVVVGVDGSPHAARAVQFATEEARLRAAPLHLVHALAWPRAAGTASPVAGADVPGAVREAARSLLRSVAAGAAEILGVDRVTWTVEDGSPADALHASGQGAQLLVVGGRGAGGVPGLLLGSTATGLALSTPCPVVVLPGETATPVRDRRSVVVGVEGRPGDEQVLAFAFAAAAARRTDLVAVHAWQDAAIEPGLESVAPMVDWAGVRADEERLLTEALTGWPDRHPDVEVREVVVRDRTARALTAVALTAQLLVVGHRAGPVGRFGSTTHGVLHRAGCPVAVVPVIADEENR